VSKPASPLYFVTSFLHSFFVFSRSRPRKLETEEELYDVALRALMRRSHSVQEMKQKLTRRADNELLVRVVLARLKESGQLDDERYAQQFARIRTQSRKQGQFRIQRELRGRGVSDSVIKATLEESATQNDPAAMVRQHIERKLKSYRGQKAGERFDDRKIAAIYGSLLRAGFPSDVIRKELHRATHESVPEVEDAPES
jgi:SOS response regulatory protein OraA/RecX